MCAGSLNTSTHPCTCNIPQLTVIRAGQHDYTQGGRNTPDNSIVHGSNYLCGTKSTESCGNPLKLAACLPATQFKAPLRKYDIAFITNDSTDMSMNTANAYSNPAEWNTRDALAKAGLFVDQRTGLLICHTCKRAVINRDFMKHYGQCVLKHASARRTVSADYGRTLEKYHLHASQHRVHNYTTAREWLESCKGQPIPRIPALPVLTVHKCTICGFVCEKKMTLGNHFFDQHKGIPMPSNMTTSLAQQPFAAANLARLVEICDDPGLDTS